MKTSICILLLTVVCFAQTTPAGFGVGSVHQNQYQLTINQQPITPNMGNLVGANTCYTQPDFLNTICRATDVTTSTINFQTHSYDLTDSGGGFDMAWNANDTLLSVVLNASG